jgi:hypothetical protein
VPRILIAYDGSEVSGRAVERVITFMKAAEVGLVTVARPIYRGPRYTVYADPKQLKKRLEAAFCRIEPLLYPLSYGGAGSG